MREQLPLQLRPDAGRPLGGARDAPALAERLHKLQAHPSTAEHVRRPGRNHTASARILDFQPEAVPPEANAHDDLFAYFSAQSEWGGWTEHVRFYAELFFTRPREALGGDPRHLVILLNVAALLISLALLPIVWRRLDPGTALFTTLLVVVQGMVTWVSLGRYLMPAFGVFIAGEQRLLRRGLGEQPCV